MRRNAVVFVIVASIALIASVALIAGCSGEPKSVDGLKKAGIQAYLDNDFPKARKYLREVIERGSSDKQVLMFCGLAYKRDYMLDSALIYLKRADLRYPDDREINQEIYNIAVDLDEWDYAKQAIRTFIRLGDPESKYYSQLAMIYSNQGSYSNVYYYLRKVYLELGMDDPTQFDQLASSAAQMDSFTVANTVLDSAVTRFGDNDQFELTRAKILFHEKKLDEAEKILRGLDDKLGNAADVKMNLANTLANQDSKAKKQEAIDLYKELRSQVADTMHIDSVITMLQDEVE